MGAMGTLWSGRYVAKPPPRGTAPGWAALAGWRRRRGDLRCRRRARVRDLAASSAAPSRASASATLPVAASSQLARRRPVAGARARHRDLGRRVQAARRADDGARGRRVATLARLPARRSGEPRRAEQERRRRCRRRGPRAIRRLQNISGQFATTDGGLPVGPPAQPTDQSRSSSSRPTSASTSPPSRAHWPARSRGHPWRRQPAVKASRGAGRSCRRSP